ncbi:hypothetical protein SpAn4DRAFT_0717 [Sporomusa ovata]|uniref:Uncharacterized protein n=1 Tax=Sporomusa ovata TaxID=2378 RepID=A0A0U1L419_9FIRM|nr:hypothetical protein SpAn4DRAFT_0717 [Sporomusa ovata]
MPVLHLYSTGYYFQNIKKHAIDKINLTEDDLDCGTANPYNKDTNE